MREAPVTTDCPLVQPARAASSAPSDGNEPLVIVGCGASKQPHPTTAGEMYLGGYHRAARAVAAELTTPARTFVLSARHGLLSLSDTISPYDLRMGQAGSVTVQQVRQQAARRNLLDARPVVVLAGRRYAQVVRGVWPHAHAPLEGVGGLGKQLHALGEMRRDPSTALPYEPPSPGPSLIAPGLAVESTPAASPKVGGRYMGTLVTVGAKTSLVDCVDGTTRRFDNTELTVWAPPLLVAAWNHLGYFDPATGGATTGGWEWLGWTVADHLAVVDARRAG